MVRFGLLFVCPQIINCVLLRERVCRNLIYIHTVLVRICRLLWGNWGKTVVKPQSLRFSVFSDTNTLHKLPHTQTARLCFSVSAATGDAAHLNHVPEGLLTACGKCVCYHLAGEIIMFHNCIAVLIGLVAVLQTDIHTQAEMQMPAYTYKHMCSVNSYSTLETISHVLDDKFEIIFLFVLVCGFVFHWHCLILDLFFLTLLPSLSLLEESKRKERRRTI